MELTLNNNSVYAWGLFNGKSNVLPTKIKELDHKQIIQVASGGNFYLALSSQGQIYGWGKTAYHRFSITQPETVLIPTVIPLKIQARFIAAGNWHSMLIDVQRQVFSVGHNKSGACGVGHFDNVSFFTPVQIEAEAERLALGDCFSLILTKSNEVFSCGHSDLNGHKSKQHFNIFKQISFEKHKIIAISAGFTHALAASDQKETFSWGKGDFFQLGHASKNDSKEPKLIKKLSGISIVQVSCTRGEKNSHSMAVTGDGNVYTWGAGYKGKLGHESSWNHDNAADEMEPRMIEKLDCKIEKSSAGGIHSNLLSSEGEVLSFGCGSDGRLGHAESSQHKYLYREGLPRVIETLKSVKVVAIESSYYHNICLGFPRT